MITKDFTGTYDYERGEAQSEAEYFLENVAPEYETEEIAAYVARIKAHWSVVLSPKGLDDFCSEWNKQVPTHPI